MAHAPSSLSWVVDSKCLGALFVLGSLVLGCNMLPRA